MTEYKALSIQQPWAWAILHAGKDMENRTWPTKYRGRLVIHAGKKIDKDGLRFLREHSIQVPDDLPTGCFVGEVDVTGCVEYTPELGQSDKWAFGPWCWQLANPETYITLIHGKGRLGLFNINPRIMMAGKMANWKARGEEGARDGKE